MSFPWLSVMLFLPSPKRLLLGYLAGALLVSLTIGFVVVFVVHDASSTSTARNAVSPSIDIAFGMVCLIVAYVLRGGHDQRLKERRRKKKDFRRNTSSAINRSATSAKGAAVTIMGTTRPIRSQRN